jgi:hypothetical protein
VGFFKRGGREQEDERKGGDPADAAAGPEEADDLAARAADLSRSFGQMPRDEQRAGALEQLNELRAAGKVSEENFQKEKRRLERWG